MDPQDEVAPSVPGEAGLRAVQSPIKTSNTNTISTLRTFQNGGDTYVERPVNEGRLFSQNRFEGYLLDCTNLAQTPKVSPFSIERQYV